MKLYPFICCGEYYSCGRNSTAHAMKNGNQKSIQKAAAEMAKFVGKDVVLIPMAGHTGIATYTLNLANEIAKLTGAKVLDIMKGRERESFYNMKKQGNEVNTDDLGLYLTEELPDADIMIVDNVVSTGTTAKAALELTGKGVVLAYAFVSRAKHVEGLTEVTA